MNSFIKEKEIAALDGNYITETEEMLFLCVHLQKVHYVFFSITSKKFRKEENLQYTQPPRSCTHSGCASLCQTLIRHEAKDTMQQYYAKFLFTKRSKLVFKCFTFMYHCRFPNNGKIKTIGLFYDEIKTHSSSIYEVELDYLIG